MLTKIIRRPSLVSDYTRKNAQIRRLLAAVLCLVLLAGCAEIPGGGTDAANSNEHWPSVTPYRQVALSSRQQYWDIGYTFRDLLPEGDGVYDPYGDFLNWGVGKLGDYVESETSTLDEDGVIMLKYDGSDNFYYNPVTVAQQALTYYGSYLRGNTGQEYFLTIMDRLMELQGETGSFPYLFDFSYYVDPEQYYKAGWDSAMATGNALSALARAYHLTEDQKYVDCAVRAIPFLDVPLEEGGTRTTLAALDPSLDGYAILEEYPAQPPTYTLNGYMYTLIGLYDWSQTGTEGSDRAKELFDEGIRTLEKILPYYDLDGFTAYDLSHITWKRETPHIGVSYHRIHVVFCKIFYDITGIETFNHYYTLWGSYVAK